MLCTIMTPTYNRADLLPRLYKSLCAQTCLDFEWLIVDDGSTDGTPDYVEGFLLGAEMGFPIRYFHKKNGGKHSAINYGVKVAEGELFLILDSDDELPPRSLEAIYKNYLPIKDNGDFCGVCGYMAHRDGTVIGRPLIKDGLKANSLDLRFKYGVKGDMAEVFRTDVLRQFPFPEIERERFCPEALVWNRMAQHYLLHVFGEVIYYRDYLVGGLTSNIVKIRMQSPVASMMTYAEMLGYKIPVKAKLRAAVNYWRFRFCYAPKEAARVPVRVKWSWAWTAPFGYLMHLNDLRVCE